MFKMRKLVFAALLTAPVLAPNSSPAAACGWYGYGYGYNAYCAPSYSYAPGAYYGYAPATATIEQERTMAGASIGVALCVVRPGVQDVGGERLTGKFIPELH
jgi:hypothetical protein